MPKLYADNASTTLASTASSGGYTLDVVSGSSFPSPGASDYFEVTLTQPSSETSWEIVKVLSRSGNTFNLLAPLSSTWAAGSVVEIRWTAGDAFKAYNPGVCGESYLDFGTGSQLAVTTIADQPDIGYNDYIDAWIMLKNTVDHNPYEHAMVPLTVRAGNITPGVGFEIYGVSPIELTGIFAVNWVRLRK